MAYKLSDLYLFSDFDRTLHSPTIGIPERNMEALRRFTSNGGKFGLATGRSPHSALAHIAKLPVNGPCLCCNGGILYDPVEDKILSSILMDARARDYVREILQRFPQIDATAVTSTGFYYLSDPKVALGRAKYQDMKFNQGFRDPIEGDWYKMTFQMKDEECPIILKELQNSGYDGVRFTSSDTYFVDMQPSEVSKGAAIERLCELLHLDIAQTAAVGDYYNDAEMLAAAGFSGCVADAPDDLKAMVDVVLCSCEDGAVAQMVELLEERAIH